MHVFTGETQRLKQGFESFLDNERIYVTFANYVLYLADRSQVPELELRNVLAVLEKIASKPGLTSRPDFLFLVDLVVRTAIRHGYTDILHTLEERFPQILTSSTRTMPRLARYYAESIVGDRFTSECRLDLAVEKFQSYLDLSQNGPDFERLFPLQLMVERKLAGKNAEQRVEAIQLYVLDLPPA